MRKAIVADDHPLTCLALQNWLTDQLQVEIVGMGSTLNEIELLLARESADLLVTDLQFNDGNAIHRIRKWTKAYSVKVVISSALRSRLFAPLAFGEGALAFVHKSCQPEVLLQAIRDSLDSSDNRCGILLDHSEGIVHRGETPYSPGKSLLALLSDREMQVLRDLGMGLSTQEIAARRFVSEKTVESHRRSIKHKLELNSLNELISLATLVSTA